MQIKNIEALKTWLTARLEKICDADPAALAKYVVALVRKDKPLGELEEICIDQLEVFLANDTVSFVKTLFEVLQSHSYIPAPPTPAIPLPEPPKPSNIPKPSNTPKPHIIPKPNTSPKSVHTAKTTNTPKTSNAPKPNNASKSSHTSKPSNTSKSVNPPRPSNLPKPSNPLVPSNPPKSPSPRPVGKRLLSTDESLRPQAAESSALDEDDRDFKRTRKPTEDVEDKPIQESNRESQSSYKQKKRRFESDHDAVVRNKVFKDDSGDSASTAEGKGRQTNDSREKEVSVEHHGEQERHDKPREGSLDRENFQRRHDIAARGKYNDYRSGKSRPYKGRPWPNKRARCRDYEEKGYCMKGEFCPFDHGSDALVVEEVNIPSIVLGFSHGVHPPGFIPERPSITPTVRLQGLRPPMPPIQFPIVPSTPASAGVHVPTNQKPLPDGEDTSRQVGARRDGSNQSSDNRPPVLAQPTIPTVRPPLPVPPYKDVVPNANDMYNPEQPSFDRASEKPPVWARLGIKPTLHHGPPAQRNRELLQVVDSKRPTTIASSVSPATTVNTVVTTTSTVGQVTASLQKDEAPQTRHSEAPAVTSGRKYTNTVLEIKKLPSEKNNISTLNGYFQKFGKIVNIQVSAFGQADAALIQFSTNAEANRAISSPEAIFGNRFIRVFWYKPDVEQKNRNVTDSQHSPAKLQVEKSVTPPTMFHTGKTSFKSGQSSGATGVKKDGNSRQVQEIMKKKLLIQKQKQELLAKQIAQQKLLIGKLELSKNLSPRDKEDVIKTLKNVSESITKLQGEVKVTVALAKSKESPAQARQVAKKELLDRELDLITHEQTGEDTTELKYRVEELKKEAQSLGLLDAASHNRGRGRSHTSPRGLSRAFGRGRGIVSRSAAVLDKRPKQLLVQGFSAGDRETILQSFKDLGDINRIEQDKESSHLVVTFGTRKQAEHAIVQVAALNIKNLKVSWYRPTSTSTSPSLKIPNESVEQDKEANASAEHKGEDLLVIGDLDEEDEEEERSWRR